MAASAVLRQPSQSSENKSAHRQDVPQVLAAPSAITRELPQTPAELSA
jgi:hypothetical protein